MAELAHAHRHDPPRGSGAPPDRLPGKRSPAPRLLPRFLAELVVPYAGTSAGQYWRAFFDSGEAAIGRFTNALDHGCDCLGEIVYLDAVLSDEQGEPKAYPNAVCIHEEDFGLLWKHADIFENTSEVRRSRRLVVSFIATVGNYDYAFYWFFYQDGSIEMEVRTTGVVLTQAIATGAAPETATVISRNLAAPNHQHLFCFRLDMDVDGPDNSVYEMSSEPVADRARNPYGNAFRSRAVQLTSERAAQRDIDPYSARYWKVVNASRRNGSGHAVGYTLIPGETTPMMASEDSSAGKRAAFGRHSLWVTPYDPDERYPAGDYPNQHPGGDGLPRWTQADRPLDDTDVVLWYTLGLTHIVRPEDWPIMPVHRAGFALRPWGFFDRNPRPRCRPARPLPLAPVARDPPASCRAWPAGNPKSRRKPPTTSPAGGATPTGIPSLLGGRTSWISFPSPAPATAPWTTSTSRTSRHSGTFPAAEPASRWSMRASASSPCSSQSTRSCGSSPPSPTSRRHPRPTSPSSASWPHSLARWWEARLVAGYVAAAALVPSRVR